MGLENTYRNEEKGISEIKPNDLNTQKDKVELIDVRGDDEFTGELGHIPGAKLVTLGPDLEQFLTSADKSKSYAFICRSGGRSGKATEMAQFAGFQDVANMAGGMLAWNATGLEVER